MPPGSTKGLVLKTTDLDTAMDELSARGLTFSHPPIDVPWGRFTSFDDPDGNGWVLQQSDGAEPPFSPSTHPTAVSG